MSNSLPRYVLRNCDIFLDGQDQIGQAKEIALPELKKKTEDVLNAGMVMTIELDMGVYEKFDGLDVKLTSFDPAVLKLFGLAVGDIRAFMATGAYIDEDGTVHAGLLYFRGFIKSVKPDAMSVGDKKTENGFAISVRSFRLEMDGEPVLEFDPFSVKVGGVSQTDKIRRALMTN